jgi:hypothetical protein
MLRIDADALFPGPEPAPAPLEAVIFLRGFAPAPRLTRVEAGREDLGRLQPVGSSLVDAPRSERVFRMAQLLAGARVLHLTVGDPDASAARIEAALGA